MRDIKLDSYHSNLIQVDLDGTLLERAENLTTFGAVKEGAVEALAVLKSKGYRIEVFTARPDPAAVKTYIESTPLKDHVAEITNVKKDAIVFIDDRSYRFEGSWNKALNELNGILRYHRDLNEKET